MSLTPPTKVQKLQEALHAKAKGSPSYRFYVLYDKVYRADVLWHRLPMLPGQRRGAGVDGQTFEDIENVRRGAMAGRTGGGTPGARRIDRSRSGGYTSPSRTGSRGRWASRRSGIAWCRWRPCWSWSRSSRPTCSRSSTPTGRTAARWMPCKQVHALLNTGHTEVVDADLSGYFDSIPHAELMKSVARRVSDRHLLHLIKMWLEAPVEEIDERGREAADDPQQGRGPGHAARRADLAAAGQPLHASVRAGLEGAGPRAASGRAHRQLCGRLRDLLSRARPKKAMTAMRDMMHRLKLTVNETKTQVVPGAGRDVRLSGLHDRPVLLAEDGPGLHLGTRPSAKKIQRLCEAISEHDRRDVGCWLDAGRDGGRLNRILRRLGELLLSGAGQPGLSQPWITHVAIGSVSGCVRKHKVQGSGTTRVTPDQYLYRTLGLAATRRPSHVSFPWANSMSPCPRAGCGKTARPVR